MKRCSTTTLTKTQVIIPTLHKPTPIPTNKIVSFQIDSGFCQYCGVDVFLFS